MKVWWVDIESDLGWDFRRVQASSADEAWAMVEESLKETPHIRVTRVLEI